MRTTRRSRRGAVLLLVLFLMVITAPIILMMLDNHTTQTRCLHNHIQGTAALYVAEAGIQDAMAELIRTPTWRDGFADKEFPAGSSHTYTVAVSVAGTDLVLESKGTTAAGFTKTVTVRLSGF